MSENCHRRSAVWAVLIALVGACFAGGYWLFAPMSGFVVLGQEPLLVQVRGGVSADVLSEDASSVHWWNKPTPAWVEVVLDPSMPVENAVSLTEKQPAFSDWTRLDGCSSAVLWCATRSTGEGVTLLATWSYEDASDGVFPLIFRLSEN